MTCIKVKPGKTVKKVYKKLRKGLAETSIRKVQTKPCKILKSL